MSENDFPAQGDNTHAIRYRWLRENFTRLIVTRCEESYAPLAHVTKIILNDCFPPTDPESVDRAIDAAMERENGTG